MADMQVEAPVQAKQSPFRWPKVYHDISLLKEVVDIRPCNPETWDKVADNLSRLFTTPVKGRGCRDHLDLLIKKYKAENSKSLKRSGSEEEYSELLQLLEDVSTYVQDCGNKQACSSKKKEADDKLKGLAMRNAAMVTHVKRKLSEDIDDDYIKSLELEEDDQTDTCKKKAKVNRRVGPAQLLTYLTNKNEESIKIKERKLDLEERKLALEEKRMQFEKEKWDALLNDKLNKS